MYPVWQCKGRSGTAPIQSPSVRLQRRMGQLRGISVRVATVPARCMFVGSPTDGTRSASNRERHMRLKKRRPWLLSAAVVIVLGVAMASSAASQSLTGPAAISLGAQPGTRVRVSTTTIVMGDSPFGWRQSLVHRDGCRDRTGWHGPASRPSGRQSLAHLRRHRPTRPEPRPSRSCRCRA